MIQSCLPLGSCELFVQSQCGRDVSGFPESKVLEDCLVVSQRLKIKLS